MKQNPEYYEIDGGAVELKVEEIVGKDLDVLQQFGLVDGVKSKFKCSELGDIMAKYCIKFETMKTILALKSQASGAEIVCLIIVSSVLILTV